MKIVFAGTGTFALPSLEALVALCQQCVEYELLAVYTRPDRPTGRGRSLKESPVKAAVSGIFPVYQPQRLNAKAKFVLEQLKPDLMVVVAYGLLLSSNVLAIPTLGCVNLHASLLPTWRGAAPIQRALIAGDTVTGITIMQMDAGLDTGPILHQVKEPIEPRDTSVSLEARLAKRGAEALLEVVKALRLGTLTPRSQSSDYCYAHKLTKEEGIIDWSLSAVKIDCHIRGCNPWPVCVSWIKGERLRVWEAIPRPTRTTAASYGEIVAITSDAITVATGEGCLDLLQLQREGGRRLAVSELLNGALSHLEIGACFSRPV